MKPKVSVIVPVYNASQYLGACINSILSQKDNNYELIIVNDGSSDNSLEIAKKFELFDPRIRVIDQPNAGAGAARNTGIDNAEGQWILFVDADDWIEPHALALIDEAPSADMIFFGFKEWRGNQQKINYIKNLGAESSHDIDDILTSLFNSKEAFFGFTFNKFYRKELIVRYNIRFDTNLLIKEDEEFILRYCRYIKTLHICSATPYNYRILSDSLSHSDLKFRRMTALALKIDIDLDHYPFPHLKTALLNAAYRYHLRGVQESCTNHSTDFALDKWIEFVRKNKPDIFQANEYYRFFAIPQKSIRRRLLRFAVLNPYYRFFSLSYYKNLFYPLYSKLK